MDKPDIRMVLEHYGASNIPFVHGWGKMLCPFHDERVASASVNLELGKFKCFGCRVESPLEPGRTTLDGFDIIAIKEGCGDFTSAKECAESIFGERYGEVLPESQGKSRRRVFGESGPKRGQRNAFSSRLRRRTFGGS